MSENNTEYTPMNFVHEYNALVAEYAKLEDRARTAMIERIAVLLGAKALNDRYDALSKAQHENNFSPDFCRMIAMLGRTDHDLDGNVRALQFSYTPK
jgi:hypothetical protein